MCSVSQPCSSLPGHTRLRSSASTGLTRRPALSIVPPNSTEKRFASGRQRIVPRSRRGSTRCSARRSTSAPTGSHPCSVDSRHSVGPFSAPWTTCSGTRTSVRAASEPQYREPYARSPGVTVTLPTLIDARAISPVLSVAASVANAPVRSHGGGSEVQRVPSHLVLVQRDAEPWALRHAELQPIDLKGSEQDGIGEVRGRRRPPYARDRRGDVRRGRRDDVVIDRHRQDEPGRLEDRGDLLDAENAAVLGDLHEGDRRGTLADNLQRVLGGVDGLVRHDRNGDPAGDLREIHGAGHWLLDRAEVAGALHR